jgi:hypothetical protein
MKRLVGVVAVLAFGCASVALSPEGQHVKMVSEQSAVAGCQLVGIADASTERGLTAETYQNAIRNKAAAMGADTVLMKYSVMTGFYGSSASAYRCAK